MKMVTVAQMRELERRAIEQGISEDSLMETAGLSVARRIAQLIDGIRGKRIVVLVGPGNNGGDGMVAARYLADWGGLVTLYMTTGRRREDKLEDCRARRVRRGEQRVGLKEAQRCDAPALGHHVLGLLLVVFAPLRIQIGIQMQS